MMFNNLLVKYLSLVFLSIFLLNTSANSFHKTNSKQESIYENKSLTEEDIARKYCALKVSPWKENGEQLQDEDGEKLGWIIEGYHDLDPQKTEKKWIFEIPLNNEEVKPHEKKLIYLKTNQFLDSEEKNKKSAITLEEFLKIICLQDKTKERISKFNKDSSMNELFEKIAVKNGFIQNDVPDLPDLKAQLTDEIYSNGLIIDEPNAVYYVPDYLISKNKEIQKAISEKNKKDKEIEDKNTSNNDYISKNKNKYILEFEAKLYEFDNEIDEIETQRKKLDPIFEEYKVLFSIAEDKVTAALQDRITNLEDDRIKELRNKIRKSEKIYLTGVELEQFEKRLSEIKDINLKKQLGNYVNLQKIIKQAKNSDKAVEFIGNDAQTILGITWKQKDPGFVQRFRDIKNLGADNYKKQIEDLRNDINEQLKLINNELLSDVNELERIDDELGNQLPWNYIVIGIVIFLAAIGFGLYVYFNNKRIKEIQEDANRTVSTLKTNLEGRLQNAAAELRSVKNARMDQTNTQNNVSSEQIAQAVPPKTPEQLIKDKFDELVSEYEEALDDFSKVATFKQKWNGLALTRKERQDGTKTILISSSRVFEKAEIWCVNFSDKYFAFPGSSVKSNMATYMNLDFEKASRDFKGVYSVSSGTNYKTEPAVLRKGGAAFVVERPGKIVFPS